MRESRGSSRTVVACIGNRFRGDDGAGHRVAELLTGCRGIEVVTAETPAELLNFLSREIDLLIVVDAMERVSEAGAIHVFDSVERLSGTQGWRSTHTMALPEVIGVAETLGVLPAKVLVFGVEGEFFGHGLGLSKSVERACVAVAEEIKRLLESGEERGEARRSA